MNDDIQFVKHWTHTLFKFLLHFKYPKEDITKLKRICKKFDKVIKIGVVS